MNELAQFSSTIQRESAVNHRKPDSVTDGGRNVEAGITPVAAIYTYSRSQGLFAGISLEGTVIGTRNDANAKYYGRAVTPEEILSGKVLPPSGAKRLVQVLTSQVFAKY